MPSALRAGDPPRIHSLDGLRAISILLVLYGHVRVSQGFPETEPIHQALALGDVAHFGVRAFFVISGFLITTLLISELKKTGHIALGSFFLKRAFRIFPAYYVYLGVMIGAAWLGWLPLPWRDAVLALTYTINYQQHRSWYVGHAWSLSVEEQFYLVWPLALRLAGVARGHRVALGAVVVAPLFRIAWALAFTTREERLLIGEAFPTVCDSIAMGCLLALLRPRLDASERYLRALRSAPMLVFALVLSYGAAWLEANHVWTNWVVGETAANLGVALLVDRYTRYPSGPVGRVLNWRPLGGIGLVSYSLYLWQQPFLVPAVPGTPASLWFRFPLNLVVTAACAVASYHLIEKPFLRLRTRLFGDGRSPTRPVSAEQQPPRAA